MTQTSDPSLSYPAIDRWPRALDRDAEHPDLVGDFADYGLVVVISRWGVWAGPCRADQAVQMLVPVAGHLGGGVLDAPLLLADLAWQRSGDPYRVGSEGVQQSGRFLRMRLRCFLLQRRASSLVTQ